VSDSLDAEVGAWIEEDPDPADRAELLGLLGETSAESRAELEDRFAGTLTFGTAGLRGAVGAGPNRMNRAVVRRASAAVAAYLVAHEPDASQRGVVIGCDARHRSSEMADEAAMVLAGAGLRVHLLPRPRPTPLTAFAVTHLGAAAAIMITASHNPREDNGYKLYLGDGAQIVPPVDEEIEALMGSIGSLSAVPLGALDDETLVVVHGDEIVDAYVAAVVAAAPRSPGGYSDLRIIYTPLHGVAGSTFLEAMAIAGYPAPYVVPEQAVPDPDFPTAPYPNPEVAGALDLAIAAAQARAGDVVIANDPDGDRLAVALPDPRVDGGWRRLSGDQLGWVLGEHLMAGSDQMADAGSRLVATTIVSSRMLGAMAASHEVRYVETLTGFKWIARASESTPGFRLLFGYEEALGYAVGGVVRDKDGIGAALAFLDLLVDSRSRSTSVLELIDEVEMRHGVHLPAQLTVATHDAGHVMAQLRAAPPRDLAGIAVAAHEDLAETDGAAARGLPSADVLVYYLEESTRVVVRPSGTEPKIKAYIEVIEPVAAGEDDPARARSVASERMSTLHAAVESLLR
jgi:phosphomannomutase